MIGAVDIGGTKVAVGIVDDDSAVIAKRDSPTGPECEYADALHRIEEMLWRTAEEAGVPVTGIGIGSTGPVDPITGAFGNLQALPRWNGANLVQDLGQTFQVKVAVENDADAGALAEAAWGAGRGKQRLVYVTIGTGIGGGIVLDGRLYRGVDGAHPEIGHHVVDYSGPACPCGLRGCWEVLACGPAMADWFQNRSGASREVTAKHICQLAREGNELARHAVEREAEYLGVGLANLINLYVPDAIVLGGSLMKSADLLHDGALAVVRRGCRYVPAEKTEIVLASLGEDVNLIGAARVWHSRFGAGSSQ